VTTVLDARVQLSLRARDRLHRITFDALLGRAIHEHTDEQRSGLDLTWNGMLCMRHIKMTGVERNECGTICSLSGEAADTSAAAAFGKDCMATVGSTSRRCSVSPTRLSFRAAHYRQWTLPSELARYAVGLALFDFQRCEATVSSGAAGVQLVIADLFCL